jgi:hypothetical protein
MTGPCSVSHSTEPPPTYTKMAKVQLRTRVASGGRIHAELSIALVADEWFGRVTGWIEDS